MDTRAYLNMVKIEKQKEVVYHHPNLVGEFSYLMDPDDMDQFNISGVDGGKKGKQGKYGV